MKALSISAVRYIYAASAYLAFLAAALWGVLFLADRGPTPTVDSTRSGPAWLAVLLDLGLWLVFGLHHSVMARAEVERWLTRVVPGRVERSTYVLTAGLALERDLRRHLGSAYDDYAERVPRFVPSRTPAPRYRQAVGNLAGSAPAVAKPGCNGPP